MSSPAVNPMWCRGDRSPSRQQLSKLLEHYQAGRFGSAEKVALSLTRKFPKHQFGWKVLAAVLGQTGRRNKAVSANQKAVMYYPLKTHQRTATWVTRSKNWAGWMRLKLV